MPTVFIVNEPREAREGAPQYDTGPASMFGDVVYVFENDGPRPGTDPSWAVEHAHSVLAQAQQGDFIVWAGGDPMTMVIVAAIMCDVVDGTLNYLAWNRTFKTYTPVPLGIFNGE